MNGLTGDGAIALLDSSPDACVLLGADGVIAYANTRANELLEQDRDALESACEQARSSDEAWFEHYLPATQRWFDVHAVRTPDGAAVWFRDVTSLRSTQVELDRRERLLSTVVDNQPECVKLVARDGTLLDMNAAGLAMIEADSIEDVRGERVLNIIASEYRDAFQELHNKVFAGENATLEFELVGLKGTRRSMETTAAPLRNDTGEIVAHLAVTHDVTARRRLEEQLRQATKMEAIGRLAGGVAHDFNNLLMAIMGYAESIESAGGETAAEAREVLRAADRAAELVRQLLAFSRRQILEPKVLDLNEAVREVEKMVSRTIGEDIAVVTNLAPDLRHVKVDAGQLQQVILNLAVNARDAMPTGGVLSFETRNVVLGDDSPLRAGSYVQLTVTDTGEGMTPDVRTHIFDPFFTTKPAGEGTGLGLATVYGIVEQSGGRIMVYSEPDLGTSFKVYLPASDEVAGEEVDLAAPIPSRPATETVLLVEDEDVVRNLVREILERDGYTVVEAVGPEEALAASRGNGHIHLLLTDVVMPRMSGPEIARSVGAARDGIKVLYMSGYSDAAVVQRGLLEPGTAFIQKPFRAQELTDKVRSLLEA